jgi:thioredoxin reductase (NADPH)
MLDTARFDCLVIGGGPAGLSAAIYLARYRRRVVVLDGGASRALSIPMSHNYPGFEAGIHGEDLLARLHAQARKYGAHIDMAVIDRLEQQPDGCFVAYCGKQQWHARAAVIATGVVDVDPAFPDVASAIASGALRYCPICDGYEAIGKNVAVIGRGTGGLGEAVFIRHFAERVSLFSVTDPIVPDDEERALMIRTDIRFSPQPVVTLAYTEPGIVHLHQAGVAPQRFDVVYVALGTIVNSGLALTLGAEATGNGELLVDAHQQTTVTGLYAVGDIVTGLNQIAVALGHAAIAATAIHNCLHQ